MSVTAENRAFEEKQPLFLPRIQKHGTLTKTQIASCSRESVPILIRTVRGGFEHLLNQVRK